jgi:hypothetical protein
MGATQEQARTAAARKAIATNLAAAPAAPAAAPKEKVTSPTSV